VAITMLLKDGNMKFLETAGVSLALQTSLEEAGLQIHLGFTDFELRTPKGISLIKIKLAASSNSIMKGTVPPAVGQAICGALTTAINKALTEFHGNLFEDAKVGPTIPDKGTLDEVLTSKVIPLTDASHLYQPVRGTSPGSKYFLVGIAGDLKVAARVMGSTVSIRVVGTSPGAKQRFIEVGMEDKGDHLSAHFEATPSATPHKIIGAVLLGTGIPFDTTLPSVDFILDKGA
jgi:hypothetical protein